MQCRLATLNLLLTNRQRTNGHTDFAHNLAVMALDHIVQEAGQMEVPQSLVEVEDSYCLGVGNLVREVGKVVWILRRGAFLQAERCFAVAQEGTKGIEKVEVRHMLD